MTPQTAAARGPGLVLAGLSDTTSHGDRPGEAKARALLEAFRDRQDDILRFVGSIA